MNSSVIKYAALDFMVLIILSVRAVLIIARYVYLIIAVYSAINNISYNN